MADSRWPGSRPGTLRRQNAAARQRNAGPVRAAPRPRPVRLMIEAIDLRTDVVPIGLRPDGDLDVPAVGPVAWYDGSPAPGELGSAVLVGPVGAVFARLRLLRPGDLVEVERSDGGVVPFVVTGIALYPKDHFPGDRMQGPRDYPALTLMTCGSVDRPNLIVVARQV
ncbi:sortase domain-containing protein [Paractinoplanes rishiriensis]|uniref:Peptidase C60 sortase A and B n=1 Tax=Paractinoplanes rishiriensis TaxID=1050105 RepID=A0A919MVG9_9ACTN|nr:sortase [Actinoplanes rishiriensis]GIF01407.1 hypothetical protein Ari01nite_88710 [Actinoplanes rishiriensis]